MPVILHPWRNMRPWKRHSLVLLVAGTVYILIGLSYIITRPTLSRTRALYYAFEVLSAPGWGVVFMLAGVLSIISSRWPPISETWGYTVLTGLSAGWSAFYLGGIWFNDSPTANYSSVAVWFLIAFMWWAISGLVNPGTVVFVSKE